MFHIPVIGWPTKSSGLSLGVNPKLYARELLIAEDDNRAKYGKYDAIGTHGGPYRW